MCSRLTSLAVLGAFYIFPGAPAGLPQSVVQDSDVLRVETQLVQVQVVVRDANGPVVDLAAGDFVLRDNGEEQEIAVFEQTRSGRTGPATSIPPGIVSNRLDSTGQPISAATVILLDRLNTATEDQIYAIRQLREFLDSPAAMNRMALYELRRDLTITHDYTSDAALLPEAVAALEGEPSLVLAGANDEGGFESSDTVGLDPELLDFATNRRSRGIDLAQRRGGDYQLDVRAAATALAMEALAHRLAGLPGRKNVVWLATRFPFTFDVYSRSDLVEEIEPGTIRQIERAAIALTDANVAVYPVSAGGTGTIPESQIGLAQDIAAKTGGRAFRTNDVSGAIREAVEDATAAYTLGFYPSENRFDREFHDLEVTVDNPDLELRHRRGYYAYPPVGEETVPIPVDDVLLSPFDATGLWLTASANRNPANDGSWDLIVLIGLDDLSLSETEGGYAGEIEVALGFEPEDEDEPSLLPGASYPIRLSEEQYQSALTTGFVFRQSIDTGGRTGRFRVAIQDRTNGTSGSLWVPAGVR